MTCGATYGGRGPLTGVVATGPPGYHAAMSAGPQRAAAAGPDDRLVALLAATAEGDAQAFQGLYEATSARLFGVCLRLVRRRDIAEDVLQEAYLRVWRRAGGYDPALGTPLAWLIAVARNAAVDRLREARRRAAEVGEAERDTDAPEPSADLMDEVLRNDSARHLTRSLQTLDDGPRQAILLSYVMGYSHEELAAELDVPLGTAKSWIRRGLIRMRAGMEQ